MNKTAPPLGGSAGAGKEERSELQSNLPHGSAQQPPKPHVCRGTAPLLLRCGSNTVTTILELVALHLRRAIPALSDLTLDDFDTALADLRPQIAELLDVEIAAAAVEMEED